MKLKNQCILITGAAGRIGSEIGKQALNQDNNQEEQPWIKPSQMTN